MKTFTYNGTVTPLKELTTKDINGSRHYRVEENLYFPSVTTVLGYFKRNAIQQWRQRVGEEEANRISNRASVRGTKFHSLMEKYLKNDLSPSYLKEDVMPDMRQAFNDAKSTLDKIDNIHYIECPLYSKKMKIAGRTDVIGEYDNILSVIDFKTSLKVKKEEYISDYFLQATAYSLMYEELTGIPINQIVIIISTDGLAEPQVWVRDKNPFVDELKSKIEKYHTLNKIL
jgi:ATP-dependent exoDNAse (exonuclease V) beta subunit